MGLLSTVGSLAGTYFGGSYSGGAGAAGVVLIEW